MDLIERQTVIDMFQNLAYDDWNQGVSTSWADAYRECAEMIRELPSEQPTPCDVCRYDQPSSMDGKPCCVCPAEGRTDV